VDISVMDKKGNLITGLARENFDLYEDGVKQEIQNFSPIEAPITVVMLIEFSRMVDWLVYDVLEAAYGFIRTLRDKDWCAIIGYDIRPTIITDFTQNKNLLLDGMRRFNTPAFSESNLSDAICDTLERVQDVEGRVAILLISTGMDTFSKVSYQKALEVAKGSNAAIYTLSIGQTLRILMDARGMIPNEARIDLLQADNRLRSFAKTSGGMFFEPRFITEYPSIFQTISLFLRTKYSVGYVSSNPKKDGKFRKIRVEVNADVDRDGKPDKLTTAYREGYVAPKP
jgi:Ca-activated chloride channel homolog